MNRKEEITLDDIKNLVETALSDFYSNDSVLMEYSTEKEAVTERCMVFRIGWYMLSRLQSIPKLRWADLDCEYNRNFNHPKSMYQRNLAGIKEKTKNAIPDLLIHERRKNENNLLVIEFKKGNPSTDDKLSDEEKLLYFTDPENEYQYSFGLYIELHKKKVNIHFFQKGKHSSHLDYTFLPQNSKA